MRDRGAVVSGITQTGSTVMARILVIYDPSSRLEVPFEHRISLGLGMAVLDVLNDAPIEQHRTTARQLADLVIDQVEGTRNGWINQEAPNDGEAINETTAQEGPG